MRAPLAGLSFRKPRRWSSGRQGGLMKAARSFVAGLVALAALALAGSALAAPGGAGAVYTLTNSPFGNAVAVFDRAGDGSLAAAGTYATGGSGTGAGLGSQGAVVLSADGRRL